MNTLPLPIAVLASAEIEEMLLIVLVQLCVIIAAARVFAFIARKVGQPVVVGEIVGGLVLGPSVFGRFFPELSAQVFDPSVGTIFTMLAQLGLVLLLFLIGLEFDFKHLRTNGRSSLAISLTGIALPFALGWALAHAMHPMVGHIIADDGIVRTISVNGFALFMGTAMSITAIPVLGRIMMELDITRTRLGAITITASAIDDATGWMLLAAVSSLVKNDYQFTQTLITLGYTVLFTLGMIFVARPVLTRLARAAVRRGGEGGEANALGFTAMAVVIIVMFLCAIATNLIGIFSIFGAFILGATLSEEREFREAIARNMGGFVTVFFLPIFFTYTGLRTDVGTLHGWGMWGLAAAVSAAAIIGKLGGCGVAARLTGCTTRDSACIGVMMNARALMELIVINIGYDLGVIPQSVFCMLVMMAVLTTIMTTPLLALAARGTELEPFMTRSGFMKPRRAHTPIPAPP